MHMLRTMLLFASFIPSIALADALVINQSPPASVMTGFTQNVKNSIPRDSTFYQSRNCKDAATVFLSNTNVVMPYELFNVGAAKQKDVDCEVKFSRNEVIAYTQQSVEICKLKGTNHSLNNVKVGWSGMMPIRWLEELSTKNTLTLKPSIYTGSSATLQGLISKDIEFGVLASAVAANAIAQDLVECPYSSDSDSEKFLGKTFSHSLPNIQIKVLILGKGELAVSAKKHLQELQFVNYLKRSGFKNTSVNIDEKSFLTINEDLQKLLRMY